MVNRKWLHLAFGVVILGLLSTASTGAIWNARRTTYFTFNRAVQIPGASLRQERTYSSWPIRTRRSMWSA